jgi:hypothetical protein
MGFEILRKLAVPTDISYRKRKNGQDFFIHRSWQIKVDQSFTF